MTSPPGPQDRKSPGKAERKGVKDGRRRDTGHDTLSHSRAHYLMAIDTLRSSLGYARTTDVAEMLEVSRGAASMALAQLKKRGWVAEDPNRFLLLTEEGRQITDLVSENFTILSRFFEIVLGVPKERAVADACKMEHLVSLETSRRLHWLTQHVESDGAAALRKHMKEFKPGSAGVDLENL